MEISNKALAVLLLAAVVISLGGTIVSLNRMKSVQTVGFATEDTGVVLVNISSSASITTADSSTLNFGQCTPGTGVDVTINSEDGENTTDVCTAFNQHNISVRNNGNVNCSVTIKVSKVGRADNATGAFLNSSVGTSSLQYKTTSAGVGYSGGCTAGTIGSYTPFTEVDIPYPACTTLRAHASTNSFITDFQIVIPYDAPVGLETTTVTFTAS